MVLYTLSWLAALLGHGPQSQEYAALAEAASPRYCFPARIEEMIVLEYAIERHSSSAKANYYLGNLYYDKRRYEDAIRCWQRSIESDDGFSIPLRNLGIAEFNVMHNPEAANRMYARAFAANPHDARVLYEWDQLKKRAGLASPRQRLRFLDEHQALVECRDDLTVEYITLLNQCSEWQAALDHLNARQFSPWEGGEGLVPAQYMRAHRELGRVALAAGKPADALGHFEAARHYPENLGEGKHRPVSLPMLSGTLRPQDIILRTLVKVSICSYWNAIWITSPVWRRTSTGTQTSPGASGMQQLRRSRPSEFTPGSRRFRCANWATKKRRALF
jgi:tetratricopeptide (TPR) repeat protein